MSGSVPPHLTQLSHLPQSTKEIALLKEVQEFLHPAAPDADLKMAVGNLNAQVASWQPILASAQQLQVRPCGGVQLAYFHFSNFFLFEERILSHANLE